MSKHERAEARPADLPPDLLELAAGRLLGIAPEARQRVVDDLVREHPEAEQQLRRLAGDLAGAERLLDEGYTAPPEPILAIGSYRVLRVIGEGAFGIVYLCGQEVPVRREVAVKVLRPGAGDRHTLARFEAERHVLATLSHPAIAQVFDAGALPDGRPYFVMEDVRGLPISSYCDRNCLDVDARLQLFVRLCHGVNHAHAKGIVHRDLKPANVLVFEQEDEPRPKIIDFGIAKALYTTTGDSSSTSALAVPNLVRTDTGRIVGTPGYMSPEQSAGNSSALDARADVFSLGVMLYELLTGELPWGRRPETTDSEPQRPSARVASNPTGDVARQRGIAPRRLASRLRGDLDWIVLKALARERERRYASAQELALDVGRHLRGEPVLAGPPALGYRLRKLVRRHRGTLSAAAVALCALALGLWLTLSFRAQARSRAADVEAAAARLLARANDHRLVNAPRSDAMRKALVQDALGFYDAFLRERPAEPTLRAGRIDALWTLSQVHWLVGEFAPAESVARECASEAESLLATAPENVRYRGMLGSALCNIGKALSALGKVDAARAAFASSVKELERCYAAEPSTYAPTLAYSLLQFGATHPANGSDIRVQVLRRVVTLREESLRERPSATAAKQDLLEVLNALGNVMMQQNDLQGASRWLRRADELLDTTPEAAPAYVCDVLATGATLAARKGNHAMAIRRFQKALAQARQWCEQEPNWPRTWERLHNMQQVFVAELMTVDDAHGAAEARRGAAAACEARMAKFPDDALARGQVADQLSEFANGLLVSGRRDGLAEAETYARRALQLLETIPESIDLRLRMRARWKFLTHLALVLDARGGADTRALWEDTGKVLATWRDQYGVNAEDADLFVAAELRVARLHLEAGQAARAGAALDRAEAVLHDHAQAMHEAPAFGAEAHRVRALLAARRGDAAAAAAEGERAGAAGEWHGLLAGADAFRAAWRVAREPAPTGAEDRAAQAPGHRERGIELYQGVVAVLRERVARSPQDPWIAVPYGQAAVHLAELLLDRGEREPARKLLEEALPLLTAQRDVAHADLWDEALYRAGVAMAAR